MARSTPNIDGHRKLVVCVDGPKVGQWFYLDDWKTQRAAALSLDGLEVRQSVLDYAPTTTLYEHPTVPGIVGNALYHRPGWDTEGTT